MPRRGRGPTNLERFESINTLQVSSRNGTDYPCSASFLGNITNPDAPMARLFDNSHDFPYALNKLLMLHNQRPSEKVTDALGRLRRLQTLEQSGEWWPDLPYNIFADCDVGLFDGKLRGMVYLKWYTRESEPSKRHLSAVTSTPNHFNDPDWGGPRLRIGFSAELILLRSPIGLRELVDSLVHEMVHAWFLLHTPHGDDPDGRSHGPMFCRGLRAVSRTLSRHTGFECMNPAGIVEWNQ